MKRNTLLYVIYLALLLFSIIVVLTGLIKFPGLLDLLNIDPFSLPLARMTWLHDWIGLALTILTLFHLALNWKWIRGMTKKLLKGKKNLYTAMTVIIFIMLLSGFVFLDLNGPETIDPINVDARDGPEAPFERNPLDNTLPVESGTIAVEEIGIFNFDPQMVPSVRSDIFNEGYFSVFDVLVYLHQTGQIQMVYEFSEELQTFIIRNINDIKDWWYVAYYDGGWPENNVWRMDLFPYKDGSHITLKKIDRDALDAIYATFSEEVQRTKDRGGEIVIPEVTIRGRATSQTFKNVRVFPHNLRNDYFTDGTITAIDVVLSLSEQGKITHNLNWYESIGSAGIVKNYFVDSINGESSYDRCGFVYEAGDDAFYGFRGNHIHIPSDLRVLNSIPAYLEYFWICI